MDINQLETLIDEHGTALYRFCLRLCGNRADAEDLYQDTFLKAVEQRHKIDASRNAKGFLYAMTVFTFKDKRRKVVRRGRLAPSVPVEAAMELGDETDLEADLLSREECQAVRRIVAAMEDRYRIPLYLHYTAEMTIGEISLALRLPEGTIKSRMHKARTLIKKKLEAEHYGQAHRTTA